MFNIAYATSTIQSPEDVIRLANKIGGILYALIIVLAVLFILIGAFRMLTAGDKEEEFKKGKKQIIYAAIAVAVSVLATGIVRIVEELAGKK